MHSVPEGLGSTGQGQSAKASKKALDTFKPSAYRRGKVSSDFGLRSDELGMDDRVAVTRADRVRIKIKDLLSNDFGLECNRQCNLKNANKLRMTTFAGNDNIKQILQKGSFLYVEAEERQKKSTFTYRVFDRDSGASSDVQVNIWFGNRAPKARRDKLMAFANTESVYDVADLLGNDRDRDGDALDLVRVWCPTGGRVSMREVNGERKVFFQPDPDFTGAAYFKYTVADLSDVEDLLVAGPGAPSPERKSFAEGIVRVRVLASPS